MKTIKLSSMGGTGKTTVAASLEAERDRLQMIYRVEILLFRDGDHDNPEIFVLLDEGEDEAPAILPEAGDFIILV
jgi:MinD superfamily P-loop ATPase